MNRLCIIPCGSRKIWDTDPAASGSYPAKLAYTGALHRKCQAYADRFFTHWTILSAKHGFLLPDDPVPGNYDVAFGTRSPDIISIDELSAQTKIHSWEQMEEIVVLGGKKFTKIVPLVFPEAGRIVYPLAGSKGIGHMLQRLDQVLAGGAELASQPAKTDSSDG